MPGWRPPRRIITRPPAAASQPIRVVSPHTSKFREPAEGGFDCSGLTRAAYAAAGVTIHRTADTQWRHGPGVPAGQPCNPGTSCSTEPRHGPPTCRYAGDHSSPGGVGLRPFSRELPVSWCRRGVLVWSGSGTTGCWSNSGSAIPDPAQDHHEHHRGQRGRDGHRAEGQRQGVHVRRPRVLPRLHPTRPGGPGRFRAMGRALPDERRRRQLVEGPAAAQGEDGPAHP